MSNPDDQRPAPGGSEPPRVPQDRGYYGAGWGTPAPRDPYGRPQQPPVPPVPQQRQPPQQYGVPPQQYGVPPQQYGVPRQYGQQPFAPQNPYPAPPRRPRRPADPSRAFAPGAGRSQATSAAIAVLGLVIVNLVAGLLFLLGDLSYPPGVGSDGASLVSAYAAFWVTEPLPFYVGSFLALAFLSPIVRRSPLPVVLLRAVLAGAAGAVAMAVVGVATGAYHAAQLHHPGVLVRHVLTTPLADGFSYTAVLLGTGAVAWLWLGRPRTAARPVATAGMPGTMPPADAVPPATVPNAESRAQYGAQPQDGWASPPAQPLPPVPQPGAQGPYGPMPTAPQHEPRPQHWSTSAPSANEDRPRDH